MQYTVRENIEGYVTLVNAFLRSMCITAKHPCLINVEDEAGDFEIAESLFYASTVAFNERFTKLMARKYAKLQTINVKVNFGKVTEDALSDALSERLCKRTFAYVGLKDTIKV